MSRISAVSTAVTGKTPSGISQPERWRMVSSDLSAYRLMELPEPRVSPRNLRFSITAPYDRGAADWLGLAISAERCKRVNSIQGVTGPARWLSAGALRQSL